MLTKSEISLIRSLADKKGRTEHGLFVAEGRKMVGEALSSSLKVVAVYATEGAAPCEGAIIVSGSQFERISRLKSPQGVLALVEIPVYELSDARAGELVLALDGVQDPGNLGTIIRTADWFGIRDVVCSETTADCYNPKVVQATMGALLRVRVHYTDLAGYLSRSGAPVYGTFMQGENIYTAADLEPGVLVMGNEGSGISPEIESLAGRRLSVPAFHEGGTGAESLNVAVASALLVAELRRRTVG